MRFLALLSLCTGMWGAISSLTELMSGVRADREMFISRVRDRQLALYDGLQTSLGPPTANSASGHDTREDSARSVGHARPLDAGSAPVPDAGPARDAGSMRDAGAPAADAAAPAAAADLAPPPTTGSARSASATAVDRATTTADGNGTRSAAGTPNPNAPASARSGVAATANAAERETTQVGARASSGAANVATTGGVGSGAQNSAGLPTGAPLLMPLLRLPRADIEHLSLLLGGELYDRLPVTVPLALLQILLSWLLLTGSLGVLRRQSWALSLWSWACMVNLPFGMLSLLVTLVHSRMLREHLGPQVAQALAKASGHSLASEQYYVNQLIRLYVSSQGALLALWAMLLGATALYLQRYVAAGRRP